MSTLDKAFIKAYQRRAVGAPHIPLTPAPVAARAPAGAAIDDRADVERVAGIATERLAAEEDAEMADEVVGDGPALEQIADEPPPTIEVVRYSVPAETPPAVVHARTEDSREAISNEADPALLPYGDLCPAFEVERFDWPETVSSLVRNNPEIGVLVDELLPDGRGAIVISGCRRGEGRTSVAMLFARQLARSGARVALVDADLRQPQLATRLGMVVEAGWEAGIRGELLPGETLVESVVDRLTLAPLAEAVSESESESVAACLKELIERLRSEFDVVCIDSGPLTASGETAHDVLFGTTPIDAAVVVRDVRHCRLEQAHAVGRKLTQLGIQHWAIVENFCGVGAPAA